MYRCWGRGLLFGREEPYKMERGVLEICFRQMLQSYIIVELYITQLICQLFILKCSLSSFKLYSYQWEHGDGNLKSQSLQSYHIELDLQIKTK